jgi:hypothetical protein
MRGRILLSSFLLFLLLFPWTVTIVEGSGEVTVKPLFQIESVNIQPKEVGIGDKVSISIEIKNNDDKVRTFYAVANIKNPDGKEETLSHIPTDLKPKEKITLTFSWLVKEAVSPGYYSVSITIWTEPYKGEIIEVPNAFKVTVSSYDQQSFDIKNRWKNTYLISISKEELEENHENILGTLKKPIELTAMMITPLSETFRVAIKEAASEFLKEKFPKYPKDVIIKIAENLIEGNYREIPADALKAFLTEEFKKMAERILTAYLVASGVPPPLAVTLSTGIVRGITIVIRLEKPLEDVYARYMISPMIESRVSFAFQFMKYTVAKLNKVNFIVKEVQDRFEIYLISYEYNFDGNKIDKIVGKAILYYVGTYERLPQVFLKKMRG